MEERATAQDERRPALPFALHAAAGMCAAVVVALELAESALVAGLPVALGGAAWVVGRIARRGPHPLRWAAVGAAAGWIAVAAGAVERGEPDHLEALLPAWPQSLAVEVEGCLTAGPRRTELGWQAHIEVQLLGARGDPPSSAGGALRLRWSGEDWPGEPPVAGDCVALSGTARRSTPAAQPFGWDGEAGDRRLGLSGSLALTPGSSPRRIGGAGGLGGVVGWLDRVRLESETAVLAVAPARAAAWILEMGSGSRAGIEAEERDLLQAGGIAHILAVSGMHLVLIVLSLRRLLELVLGLGLGRCPRCQPRWLGALATIPLAWLYAAFTGMGTATVRAAWFLTFSCATELRHGRPSLVGALSATVVVVAWLRPEELLGAGFQLSVVAVAGIAAGLRRGRRPATALIRARRGLANLVRASLGASLATTPILAHHFGITSVSGLLANIVLAPILGTLLVGVAALALMLALIEPSWAGPPAQLVEASLALTLPLLDGLARGTGDPLVLGRPGGVEQVFAWGMLVCVVGAVRQRRVRRNGLRRAGLLAVLLAIAATARLWPSGALEVWFVPVGQGDATLVRFPTGQTLLVDAGGQARGADPGRTAVLPLLRGLGVARLDVAVVSHGDLDHLGGMFSVLDAYPPRELWISEHLLDRRDLAAWTASLSERGTRVRAFAADSRTAFALGGVDIQVLLPAAEPGLVMPAEENDRSLCLSLTWEGRRVLLVGDVEALGETLLVRRYGDTLAADVLKVPHHGSRTSSGWAFLAHAWPSHALFGVGADNRFGFPHPDVLERYGALGASIWRTDLDGLIHLRLDREGVRVDPWRERSAR